MSTRAVRRDIEMLRAFAVGTVLLFHASLAQVRGGFIGVDIFFVISGYLILGALFREFDSTGKVQIAGFLARRARRLLPASALVIGITALTLPLAVGRLTANEIRLDLFAAAASIANFRFAASGSDYWAPDYLSPVLHFWSLSVEEQFYLAVPLLFLAFGFSPLLKRRFRKSYLGALAAFGLMSLAFALTLTPSDPITGYYHSFGRVWEFAAGGFVAVLRTPNFSTLTYRLLRAASWWILIFSAWLIEPAFGYPGPATVIPVLATAMLVWLGANPAPTSPSLFTAKLVTALESLGVWLGGISYSIYLWHWPLLWLAAILTIGPSAQPHDLSAITAISVLCLTVFVAAASKRFVEDPFRNAPAWRGHTSRSLTASTATIVAAALLSFTSAYLPTVNHYTTGAGDGKTLSFGGAYRPALAQAVGEIVDRYAPSPEIPADKDFTPAVENLRADKPAIYSDGCHAGLQSPADSKRCAFGQRGTSTLVYLVGDSHAAHYFDGLLKAAKTTGFELRPRTRSSCPPWSIPDSQIYSDQVCRTFQQQVLTELLTEKPDVAILSGFTINQTDDSQQQESLKLAYRKTIQRLVDAGIKVLVLRDLPMWPFDPADCLATASAKECTVSAGNAQPPAEFDIDIANQIDGAAGIDLSAAVCETTTCPTVRAGLVVYRDQHHLTATYSRSLGRLWSALIEQMPDLIALR